MIINIKKLKIYIINCCYDSININNININNKILKLKMQFISEEQGFNENAHQNIHVSDPNLMKYSVHFDNYQVVIYGEHHFDHDYTTFVINFKTFLQSNPDKKYVIVLEVDEDLLYKTDLHMVNKNIKSISHLLAFAYTNKEFDNFTNVTFIAGDNRTETFNNILDCLGCNIYDFPEQNLEYKLSNDANDKLLDVYSIILSWANEANRFEGVEYDIYKMHVDNLLNHQMVTPTKFKDLYRLLDQLWFYWCRISNIWMLNKIKSYMNKDYNMIFITGGFHFFDYIYLLDQEYKSDLHFFCDKYKIEKNELEYLFSQAPLWGEKFDKFYQDKCNSYL